MCNKREVSDYNDTDELNGMRGDSSLASKLFPGATGIVDRERREVSNTKCKWKLQDFEELYGMS